MIQVLLQGTEVTDQIDVTDHLVNWADIGSTISRKDYGGALFELSNKFEFAFEAANMLRYNFMQMFDNQTYGVKIIIKERQEDWTYKEIFSADLDFATFEDDGNKVSISGISSNLISLINSNRSQVYDIEVSELQELSGKYQAYLPGMPYLSKGFLYEPLVLKSSLKYVPFGEEVSKNGFEQKRGSSGYEDVNRAGIDVRDFFNTKNEIALNSSGTESSEADSIIFEAKEDLRNFKIDIKFNYNAIVDSTGVNVNIASFFRLAFKNAGQSQWTQLKRVEAGQQVNSVISIPVKKGFKLRANIITSIFPVDEPITHKINFERFDISYEYRNQPFNIDGFTTKGLLKGLVDKITKKKDVDVKIELESPYNLIEENSMLASGESARSIPLSQVHTSFDKFSKFMETVYGAVWAIEKDVSGKEYVCFKSRNLMFSDDVVARIKNYRDLKINVNEKLLYSGVTIGFDNQDYNSINGRDEHHFSVNYKTGNNLTNSILRLNSPYRADCYGFEFATHDRLKETTDRDSDSDIFVISTEIHGSSTQGGLALIRRVYNNKSYLDKSSDNRLFGIDFLTTSVLNPLAHDDDYIFNAKFSPRLLLEANSRYLASFTNSLTFTSHEGNSGVTIRLRDKNNTPYILWENSGVDNFKSSGIKRLFSIAEASFETPDTDLPQNLNGLVEIESDKKYKGYILNTGENYGMERVVKYILAVKEII